MLSAALLAAFILAFTLANARAQAELPAGADAAWQILSELPKFQRSTAGGAAQGQREALADAWGQKLEQARAFQSSHPDDPRCGSARKMEATALLKLQQMASRKPLPLEDSFIDACTNLH